MVVGQGDLVTVTSEQEGPIVMTIARCAVAATSVEIVVGYGNTSVCFVVAVHDD
jgi:hypothetical protein